MDHSEARQRLESERDRLLRMRAAQEDEEQNWHDPVKGGEQPADAAANLQQREVEQGIHDFAEDRLGDIEAALGRLDEGSYGICAVCGDPIDDERLREVPETAHCLEHADTAA